MKLLTLLSAMTLLASTATHAATISLGDSTTNLNGSLFIDQASTTGGDTPTLTAPATQMYSRVFDLNGAVGAPGVAGTLTLQGFGFATNAGTTTNTATNVMLAFIYLGADQVFGGGDDVNVGITEAFVWNDGTIGNGMGWEGAGEYYVNFDTDPSVFIDGLGEAFRIVVTPTPTGGAVRFKTTTGTALSAAKFSFSGTFNAIPEPAALVLFAPLAVLAAGRRR